MRAELAFVNGTVITVNGRDEVAEALSVHGSQILAVGSAREVLASTDEHTNVVDLAGCSLIPGFVDNHIHMANAYQRRWVDCSYPRCQSISDIVEALATKAHDLPADLWLLGRGFDPARLKEGRTPNRHDLDEALPTRRVGICNREGMGWTFNTLGLEAIGIRSDTPDPAGGRLERDANGIPLGPMWDNARTVFINPHLPNATEEDLVDGYAWIERMLLEAGITTAYEAGYREAQQARAWQLLRQRQQPRLRIRLGPYPLHGSSWNEDGAPGCLFRSGLVTGFGDDWLRLGWLQMGVDGGLFGRTAALTEPYADGPPGFRGNFRVGAETLTQAVSRAHKSGWEVGLVCQGDAGIDRALTAIAHGATSRQGRQRLEHAYVWSPESIERAAKLGVVWNTQPHILPLIGRQLVPMLGKRARWAFPFRSLVDHGIIVSGGSDWSVGSMNPFIGIDALVNHRSDIETGAPPLVTDETLTLRQALRAYTLGGAIAGGEEGNRGSLEPGKLADLVTLDRDLTKIASDEIVGVGVTATYVGGRLGYSRFV